MFKRTNYIYPTWRVEDSCAGYLYLPSAMTYNEITALVQIYYNANLPLVLNVAKSLERRGWTSNILKGARPEFITALGTPAFASIYDNINLYLKYHLPLVYRLRTIGL